MSKRPLQPSTIAEERRQNRRISALERRDVNEEGGAAGDDKNFIYIQGSANVKWTVPHNLEKYPSVRVEDATGKERLVRVVHLNANTLEIHFGRAMSGKAYLN